MKCNSYTCQCVVPHPDHTMTAVRIGLTRWTVQPGQPAQVACHLVTSLRYEAGESKTITITFVIKDADGATKWHHEDQTTLQHAGGGSHQHITVVNQVLPVGEYQLNVLVDGQLEESLPLEVVSGGKGVKSPE